MLELGDISKQKKFFDTVNLFREKFDEINQVKSNLNSTIKKGIFN